MVASFPPGSTRYPTACDRGGAKYRERCQTDDSQSGSESIRNDQRQHEQREACQPECCPGRWRHDVPPPGLPGLARCRRRGGAGLGFPQGPADPGSPKRSAHEVRHRAHPELVRGLRKLQLEPEGMRRGRALAFARARCECYVGIVLISSICKFALTAFRSPGTRAILPMRKPLALTGFMETMLISHASRRAHTGHCNPNSGTGRSMTCRPVGLCPPERFDRGWTANRGPRCTRVSAMRVVGFGGASRVRSLRTSRPARHVSARREIG